MIKKAWLGPLSLGVALALASGCGAGDGVVVDEDIGQVGIYLSSVPSNGTCLRFTTTAGTRSIQQSFDATSGTPLTAELHGLPYNVSLSISAEAFAGECAALTPASLATYLSDTQVATLMPGETRNLAFTLRPTGNVNGTAEFLFLTMAPTSRTFGNIVLGQEGAPFTFTITNIGMVPTSPLSASITELGATPGQFTIASTTCDTELAASATCTVQVKLTPTTPGTKNATLQVKGMTGGTVQASLTGVGWNPARLTLPGAILNLGNVPVGSINGWGPFITVNNAGDEPTGVVTATLSPTTPELSLIPNSCTGVLAGRQSCQVIVRFAPQTFGPQSATLTVTASPGGTASSVISGTGVSPLTFSPTSANFGSSPVGAGGMSQTLVIRNASSQASAPLTVSASSADFRVTSDGCSAKQLLAGATCSVTVQLVPSAAGALNGTLTVNGAAGWTAEAALTGSGT